jgi:hypothetical protein
VIPGKLSVAIKVEDVGVGVNMTKLGNDGSRSGNVSVGGVIVFVVVDKMREVTLVMCGVSEEKVTESSSLVSAKVGNSLDSMIEEVRS